MRRGKWARRLRDAWRGLTGRAYLPPIGIRFTVNGLTLLESTSEDLHLVAKWGGTDEGEWRELLGLDWPDGDVQGLVTRGGDRIGLFVRWSRG